MALGELVDRVAKDRGMAVYAACRLGTPPVLGAWQPARDLNIPAWNQAVLDFAIRHKIRHVLLAARWTVYVEECANQSRDFLIADSESRAVTPEEAQQALERRLASTIQELRKAGVSVWIIKQVPEQRSAPNRALAVAELLSWQLGLKGVSLADHRRRQFNVNRILATQEAEDVRFCDPAEFSFDPTGNSRIAEHGQCYYIDADHLSPLGAEKLLGAMVERCLDDISGDSRW